MSETHDERNDNEYQVRPLPVGARLAVTRLSEYIRINSPLSRDSARALVTGCLHGYPVRITPYQTTPFRRPSPRRPLGTEYIVAQINAASRERGCVYLFSPATGKWEQLALNALGLVRPSFTAYGTGNYLPYAAVERDPHRLHAYYHPEAAVAYAALAGV